VSVAGQVLTCPDPQACPVLPEARQLRHVDVEGEPVQGLIWHSRQAELLSSTPAEAVLVFVDRYRAGRGGWHRVGPGSQNLIAETGRLLIDEIATQLDATVVS
jgi:hypothetical protein